MSDASYHIDNGYHSVIWRLIQCEDWSGSGCRAEPFDLDKPVIWPDHYQQVQIGWWSFCSLVQLTLNHPCSRSALYFHVQPVRAIKYQIWTVNEHSQAATQHWPRQQPTVGYIVVRYLQMHCSLWCRSIGRYMLVGTGAISEGIWAAYERSTQQVSRGRIYLLMTSRHVTYCCLDSLNCLPPAPGSHCVCNYCSIRMIEVNNFVSHFCGCVWPFDLANFYGASSCEAIESVNVRPWVCSNKNSLRWRQNNCRFVAFTTWPNSGSGSGGGDGQFGLWRPVQAFLFLL